MQRRHTLILSCQTARLVIVLGSVFTCLACSEFSQMLPERPLDHRGSSVSESGGESALSQRLADVIANPDIFNFTPENVANKLKSIAKIKDYRHTEYVWQFVGDKRDTGIRWVDAQFQPSEPGSPRAWSLIQIRFGIVPLTGDYDALYAALDFEVGKRLSPQYRKSAGRSVSVGNAWAISEHQEVRVRQGEFQNPFTNTNEHVILIEVAVLQGEEE